MLLEVTGSNKSKMVAAQPEVLLCFWIAWIGSTTVDRRLEVIDSTATYRPEVLIQGRVIGRAWMSGADSLETPGHAWNLEQAI